MKRFITIFVILSMVCSLMLTTNIMALNPDTNVDDSSISVPEHSESVVSYGVSQSERIAIIEMLDGIAPQKDLFGLSDVNFDNIYIGEKIYMYELTQNGSDVITYMYPLIYNGEVVLTAICMGDDAFQISRDFSNMIVESDAQNMAMVFDADSCQIFDGETFKCVNSFENNAQDDRVTLETFLSANQINISDISHTGKLNEIFHVTDMNSSELLNSDITLSETSMESRAYDKFYYEVIVDFERQLNYNICWAASIVMTLSAFDIDAGSAVELACDWFEVNDLSEIPYDEQGQDIYEVKDALNHYLNGYSNYLAFAYVDLDEQDLARNISGGYPIIGGFVHGDNQHMVTICGVYPENEWLCFYDPNGSNANDGYHVIHRYTNATPDQEIYGRYAFLADNGYWYYYRDTISKWGD